MRRSARTSAPLTAPLALLALALGGCSAIPPGGDPAADPAVRALAARGQAFGLLSIAPVTTLALAADEVAKGWRVADARGLDLDGLRDDVARALGAAGGFSRVRLGARDAMADAWRMNDDVVAAVAVVDLRTSFDGRNGWWIPNILNWLFWMVPAWFVATEEFSLTATCELELRSAESGAVLARDAFEVQSQGTFDEFDRGWHFFGFVYTPLDPERWRLIATRLWPEARRRLAVEVARRTDGALRALVASPDFAARTRKTLGLVVGVSRYEDALRLPPLGSAADDARAVAAALLAGGTPPEHLVLLSDGQATLAAIESAAREHLGRARPDDDVVVYLAGYGTRDAAGRPAVVLADGGAAGAPPGAGLLTLDALAARLATLPGRKLVVVDAAFDGGRRSIVGGAPAAGASDLPAGDLSLLLAAGPGEPALEPEHLGHGLFTDHLLRGLEGAADGDGDGRLAPSELLAWVRPRVVADAALLGVAQSPRGGGLEGGPAISAARAGETREAGDP